MRRFRLNAIGGFFLAVLLCTPAWGANPAQPGTINYVEAQVSVGNQPLDQNAVGSAVLQAGQTLTTGSGKAEILLTPGVFLRVADNSSVTMVSPGLATTEIRLVSGRAMVEVAEIHGANNLVIDEFGTATQLVKRGLYDFDADRGQIRVFDGQAMVRMGNEQVKLKGGHEFGLNGPAEARKFDKDNFEDSFYRWASLRSDYLAEANIDAARDYVGRGNYWAGAGWYWDPWFGAYTFIPADGVLYSPFGWGFYSPWFAYGAPFVYYGHSYHHFDRGLAYNAPIRAQRGSAFELGRNGGGMHSSRGFGGFHGAGGLRGGRR